MDAEISEIEDPPAVSQRPLLPQPAESGGCAAGQIRAVG